MNESQYDNAIKLVLYGFYRRSESMWARRIFHTKLSWILKHCCLSTAYWSVVLVGPDRLRVRYGPDDPCKEFTIGRDGIYVNG